MWIHLNNEKEHATVNMNFAVFFGMKELQHKEALKQIINTFGCSVNDVSTWFETAIVEFKDHKVEYNGHYSYIPSLAELMKNYEYFKKTYLPKEKVHPVVKKINSYKSKFKFMSMLDKLIIQHDKNTVVMADSEICFIYSDMNGVTVKEQHGTGDLLYFKNMVSEYIKESTVGESHGTLSLSELKNIANTGYIQIEDAFFDVKPIIKLLNKKGDIHVYFNKSFGKMSRKVMIFTQKDFVESTTIVLNSNMVSISNDAIIYIKEGKKNVERLG